MSDLISVIVPVYNVEEYLGICIDSILAQTYENLEIILVDDGSTDCSGEICDRYGMQDHRVVVEHVANGGQSYARNLGIARAAGEWITFVDSDDVIAQGMIESLYDLALQYRCSIAGCGLRKFTHTDTFMEQEFSAANAGVVMNRQQALYELLYQKRLETGVWAKLYRRELFAKIQFPVGMIYEDLATLYRVLEGCERIVVSDAGLYGYRIRQESTMHQTASPKMLSCIPVSRQLYTDICERYPQLQRAAASRAFSVNRCVYLNLDRGQIHERKKVFRELTRYRGIIVRDPDARMRERIMALISYLGPAALHMFSGWYKRQQDRIS